jgi:two-component system, response regulator PdtaR
MTTTGAESTISVLLAEDDANARSLLTDLLNSLGYSVLAQVGSGREAVRRTQEVTPDVVLLDVHMPDGSGIEAAEEITQQAPGTAVVLFSGDESVSLSDREVSATAAIAFLPKPTPPRVLDATIRLAVSRARELATARKDATAARQQLENRKIIERAKGILMRRTGSSEQEAYRILQRTSQDRSVPMVTIAKAVLDSEPGAQPASPTQTPPGAEPRPGGGSQSGAQRTT